MINAIKSMYVAGLVSVLAMTGCQTKKTIQEGTETEMKPFGKVTLAGDFLAVDGENFFVVGVGYEPGCRPGLIPWKRPFHPELMSNDFRRIREAGFNTIRTWGPMMDEELALAREFGLWVIQGLWFDPGADFSDPAFQKKTFETVEKEISRMSKFDNILYYLLLNEPHADAVCRTGINETEAFYTELIRRARAADPKRLFSYSNCIITDFMDPEKWEIISQNVYPYSPCVIDKALGYYAYLEILKKRLAPDKPMLITEFGLAVSPTGDGRGYGGNSLQEQADGVVQMWDDIINVGCAGGCAFMWIDGWWKHGNEHVHNDHAEEWYGLLGADENRVGTERPVYFALKDYNQAIRLLPHDQTSFQQTIPIQVWGGELNGAEARIVPGGKWLALKNTHHDLWEGQIDCSTIDAGEYRLETRGMDRSQNPISEKSCRIHIKQEIEVDTVVRIENLPETLRLDDAPLKVSIRVTDQDGNPLPNRDVQVARFVHTKWNEFDTTVRTDENGEINIEIPLMENPGVISIAAAVVDEETGRTSGDYRHVMITNCPL